MSRRRRPGNLDAGLAAVAGGTVTSERLLESALRDGRDRVPLIRKILSKKMPDAAEIARTYAQRGGLPRIERSEFTVSARAARLLDLALLRRLRCVPLECFEDVCIIAVELGRAESAVKELRPILKRDIFPVLAHPDDLDAALNVLPAPEAARRHVPARRNDSPVHERFRSLAIHRDELDGIALRIEK